MNRTGLPEIGVAELARKLATREAFVLLDVREPAELRRARIEDGRVQVLPLSRLAHQGAAALPEAARAGEIPVYVMCHHGNRSLQVTAWLVSQGHAQAFNVSGGIDAYARLVDRSVGMY